MDTKSLQYLSYKSLGKRNGWNGRHELFEDIKAEKFPELKT